MDIQVVVVGIEDREAVEAVASSAKDESSVGLGELVGMEAGEVGSSH